MAQMHSFLIENAKSELNYVDPNLREEDFLSIFNEIANSMKDGTDLFSEEDSFLFQEFSEDPMDKEKEEFSEELDDLVGENSVNLEVENLINLTSKLDLNESSSSIEEIVHGDTNFDIDDLL
ncbi:zinc finger bed domain-containing protein 1-like [Gigaspora margarita]|uniref:Zinc finger bed domain-containing protein 1-like n=1 Tax=Gigaspora margarita TaxID=4874 RepID=A0A8H3XAF1_GIGMA|nr:zinc finger bed domain-containing protein 1-like [Gigaspora margarita]